MTFKRARSEEQILERKKEILNTAALIYDKSGHEGLSFSEISKHTNFTRPTIYKYFNTKEEILLEILLNESKSWIETLIGSFKLNKLYSVEEISEIWSNSLCKHNRLLKLYSILFTVIEKNVSLEALINFKQQYFDFQAPLIDLLSQLFPKAEEKQIFEFIAVQLTLALGIYPMCNLTEIQLKAMESINIDYELPDFKMMFKNSVFKLMYCLENNIN